jgi:hypothetical protein
MKRHLLLAATLLISLFSNAQYTITDHHTAEELSELITGANVVVLNPVLSCGDTSNGIYSGTGSLDFDNGVILSTNRTVDITPFLYGSPAYSEEKCYTDEGIDVDMNNYLLDSNYTNLEAYNACVLEMDIVPNTTKIRLDYIFASSEPITGFGGFGGCDPNVDMPVVFIKGGSEYPSYLNLATYPGTNIPVNTTSLSPETPSTVECPNYAGAPFDDYYVANEFGEYPDIDYRQFSKELFATADVSICDTYHLKLAIADIRGNPFGWQGYGSSLFFKASSLRGEGQPGDCTTSLDDYYKQQSQIKVSPNPFVNSLGVQIEGLNATEQMNVSLTDIQGRILKTMDGNLSEVNTKLTNTGVSLTPGMYFLNIKSFSGKYNHSVKVVKQ